MVYFFVYSLIGWLAQSAYLSVRRRTPVNAGFLCLPVCPMYGFCMAFLLVFVYPHGLSAPLLFPACFAVVALSEYFTNWAFDIALGLRLWDYRDYEYNINGRVATLWAVFFGAAATAALIYAQPALDRAGLRVPDWWIYTAVTLMILDFALNLKVVADLKRRLAEMTALRAGFSDCLQRSNVYDTPRQWLEFVNIHFEQEAVRAIHQTEKQIVTYGDVSEQELASMLALIRVRYKNKQRPAFLERRLLGAFYRLRVYGESESLSDLE